MSPCVLWIDEIAEASDGFSGAEIEQVVVSALYAIRENEVMGTQCLITEVNATRPLSVVMAEKNDQLREWSSGRTVPVD